MKTQSVESQSSLRAFSLVEVVVAVGVFAVAIVSVIGILASIGKSVAEVGDADKAARLVGVIQAKIQASPFSAIAGSLKLPAAVSAQPASYNPAEDPQVFFASEDGAIVAPFNPAATNPWGVATGGMDDTSPAANALKYFELTLIRNETLSPVANDKTAGFVAFNIRIRWPAYLPDGTRVTDHTQKEVLIVPAAVTR